jgi:tetratricopeptide (TPR) repeat protein
MDVIRSRLGPIALIIFGIILFKPTPLQRGLVESIEKAKVAGAAGRTDAALSYLEGAIKRDDQLTPLYINIAQAALASDDLELASRYVAYFQEGPQDDARSTCLEFDLLSKLDDPEAAIEIWGQKEIDCPNDIEYLRTIALKLISERDFPLARQALSELSKVLPADAEIQFLYGILLATSKPETSLAFLRLSNELEIDGNAIAIELVRTIEDSRIVESEAYTLAQVGQVLTKYGYWSYAASAFQLATELEPSYADAFMFLGLSLDEIGKNGLESFQHAIDLSNDQAIPYIYLGIHWLRNDSPDKALQNFELAARLDPENPIVTVQIGHVHEFQGEIELAMQAYRAATELAPQDPAFWIILAQASLGHEFNVAAIGQPAARNALALEPDNPVALDALGYSYFLLGDLDYADRLISRAIGLEPLNPLIQYHLGLLRASQNRYQQAQSAFELAFNLDPEGGIGKMAERALATISQ